MIRVKLDSTFCRSHEDNVCCMLLLADETILTGSFDHNVKRWAIEEEFRSDGVHLKSTLLQTFEGHTYHVSSLVDLTNAKEENNSTLRLFASGSKDDTVRIWSLKSGACVHSFVAQGDWVSCMIRLRSSGLLVCCSFSDNINLWNIDAVIAREESETNTFTESNSEKPYQLVQLVAVYEEIHSTSILSILELRNSNGIVASGDADDLVKIWNSSTGECLQTLTGHSDWVSGLSQLSNGQLLTWSHDHTIKIWNWETGECLSTFKGHSDTVTHVTELFAHHQESCEYHGSFVLLSSSDSELRIWNEQGYCLQIETTFERIFSCVKWRGDGRVLCGSEEGDIYVISSDLSLTNLCAFLLGRWCSHPESLNNLKVLLPNDVFELCQFSSNEFQSHRQRVPSPTATTVAEDQISRYRAAALIYDHGRD